MAGSQPWALCRVATTQDAGLPSLFKSSSLRVYAMRYEGMRDTPLLLCAVYLWLRRRRGLELPLSLPESGRPGYALQCDASSACIKGASFHSPTQPYVPRFDLADAALYGGPNADIRPRCAYSWHDTATLQCAAWWSGRALLARCMVMFAWGGGGAGRGRVGTGKSDQRGKVERGSAWKIGPGPPGETGHARKLHHSL